MFVIDRLEGQLAVVEYNRQTFKLPRSIFPKEVKEGDVINIQITVDTETTNKTKRTIDKLADRLFED